MKTCPVCQVTLEGDISSCHVCDADLSILGEMDGFKRFIREEANRFWEAGERVRALAYVKLAQEWDPDDLELLRREARALDGITEPDTSLNLWRTILEVLPEDDEAIKRCAEIEETM